MVEKGSFVAPRMVTLRQRVPTAPLADVPEAVRSELHRIELGARIQPGARIAVAAGSRGITDYALIIKTVVAELRQMGAAPFVFAAMGSHGGATEEGQRMVLAELGITAETVGCPISTAMEVQQIGTTPRGLPVFCDAAAFGSDGILVVNRVKVHTDFHGPTESGLTKMLAIGLGKRAGAELIHGRGVRGLREDIPAVAAVQLEKAPILGGLAIVEDGAHHVSAVRAVPAERLPIEEPQLLDLSRSLMARLPVDACNLLIVEEIGKEISGAGMDPNVIGRLFIDGEAEPVAPHFDLIVALRLTAASHGNAIGTGFADIIARPLLDARDAEITEINVRTSGFPRRGLIPSVAPTEERAIAQALDLLRRERQVVEPTIMRVRNTLELAELQVSESLAPALRGLPGVEIMRDAVPLRFSPEGSLLPW